MFGASSGEVPSYRGLVLNMFIGFMSHGVWAPIHGVVVRHLEGMK